MKVVIRISWKTGEDEYYGYSDEIEWDYPIPNRGDLIYVCPEAFKMNYDSEKSERAINDNLFPFKENIYRLDLGVMEFLFGESDEDE